MYETARALAAHPKFVWLPGMACRDPKTSLEFRRGVGVWYCLDLDPASDFKLATYPHTYPTLTCAMAAGPLLDDWPTIGALLGLMGEMFVNLSDHSAPRLSRWECGSYKDGEVRIAEATPGLAIGQTLLRLLEPPLRGEPNG